MAAFVFGNHRGKDVLNRVCGNYVLTDLLNSLDRRSLTRLGGSDTLFRLRRAIQSA